jgi:3-oxoadipate enol-lactonase
VTTELHALVDGRLDAPVLVLGPSLGTTTALWAPALPFLTDRYRVIRYDHRGHGGSPVPAGPYRIEDLGGDVLALLDRLGVGRAHVAGVSLGGMVAMWVAAHAPERVDRLMPICTTTRFTPPEMWRDRAAAVRANGLSSIADAVVARWLPPDADPAVVAAAYDLLAGVPDEGYANTCAALEVADLGPDLGRITAPTLVFAGEVDPASPPAHAERIAAGIAGARVTVVPGAAHLAVLTHPAVVAASMTAFLEETDE